MLSVSVEYVPGAVGAVRVVREKKKGKQGEVIPGTVDKEGITPDGNFRNEEPFGLHIGLAP